MQPPILTEFRGDAVPLNTQHTQSCTLEVTSISSPKGIMHVQGPLTLNCDPVVHMPATPAAVRAVRMVLEKGDVYT